jgi:hypothetical protein
MYKSSTIISAILLLITGNCFANPIEPFEPFEPFEPESPIHIIDFMGENKGVQESFNFQQAGVNLTIQAWVTNVNTDQKTLQPWSQLVGDFGVYKGSTGLGVISNDEDGSDLDGGRSANTDDLDEGLLFSFSEQVNFLGFVAGSLSDNDDLNLAVVDFISPTQLLLTDVFVDVGSAYEEDIFDVFPGIIGRHFMVWVDSNDDDDVRIIDTAFIKVPEPTTLSLFGLALIFINNRRSRQC